MDEQEESIEETLRIFAKILEEIENGKQVKLEITSNFLYEVADQIEILKEAVNEQDLVIEGLRRGVETYVYDQVEILDSDGELITTIDKWVTKELIDQAVRTYILQSFHKAIGDNNDNN